MIITLLFAGNIYGQSLKKYAISTSGCSAYLFCDPTSSFSHEKSQDSSDVYTCECTNDGTNYGVICVKLKEKIDDLTDAESVLIAYLDFLKNQFGVNKSTGYGKGHRLKNNENTRGVIDYWEDKDGISYKIKGWADGKYIAVLYAAKKGELAETKVNIFLESLSLP